MNMEPGACGPNAARQPYSPMWYENNRCLRSEVNVEASLAKPQPCFADHKCVIPTPFCFLSELLRHHSFEITSPQLSHEEASNKRVTRVAKDLGMSQRIVTCKYVGITIGVAALASKILFYFTQPHFQCARDVIGFPRSNALTKGAWVQSMELLGPALLTPFRRLLSVFLKFWRPSVSLQTAIPLFAEFVDCIQD